MPEPFNPPKIVKTNKHHGINGPDHPELDLALLHTAEMIGGKTESTLNNVKIPNLKMYWIKGDGLFYQCKGQEGLIPFGNIRRMVFKI